MRLINMESYLEQDLNQLNRELVYKYKNLYIIIWYFSIVIKIEFQLIKIIFKFKYKYLYKFENGKFTSNLLLFSSLLKDQPRKED